MPLNGAGDSYSRLNLPPASGALSSHIADIAEAIRVLAGREGVSVDAIIDAITGMPADRQVIKYDLINDRLVWGDDETAMGGAADGVVTGVVFTKSGNTVTATLNRSNMLATLSGTFDVFSGDYGDLDNRPTIPAAQVPSDWNATTGVAQILNKPTIPDAVVANPGGMPTTDLTTVRIGTQDFRLAAGSQTDTSTTSQGSSDVAFTARTWNGLSGVNNVPSSAAWIFVRCEHEAFPGVFAVSAAQWRGIQTSAASSDTAATNRVQLGGVHGFYRGVALKLWLGRDGDAPLIAFDGGRTGQTAAAVEVFTSPVLPNQSTPLVSAAVDFNSHNWFPVGTTAIPAAATWLWATLRHAVFSGTWLVNLAQWRAAGVGEAGMSAGGRVALGGVQNIYRGVPLKLTLGRTSTSSPLISYGNGVTAVPAAAYTGVGSGIVELYTA